MLDQVLDHILEYIMIVLYYFKFKMVKLFYIKKNLY